MLSWVVIAYSCLFVWLFRLLFIRCLGVAFDCHFVLAGFRLIVLVTSLELYLLVFVVGLIVYLLLPFWLPFWVMFVLWLLDAV